MSEYSEPLTEAQKQEAIENLTRELDSYRKEQVRSLMSISDRQKERQSDIAGGRIDISDPSYIEMLERENETYARHMEAAKDADMRPEKFALRDGKLVDPTITENNTNNSIRNNDEGVFSELFDLEQVGLVGLVTQATKDEVNKNNPYEIKESVAYKNKGSDITTNMYVVQDESNRLWLMADQRDAENNIINQNQDSFRAIGINPSHLRQNTQVGGTTSQADIDAVYSQISPNGIRMAINKDQMLPLESRVSYIAAMEEKERAEVAAENERRAELAQSAVVEPEPEPKPVAEVDESVTKEQEVAPGESMLQRLQEKAGNRAVAVAAVAVAARPTPMNTQTNNVEENIAVAPEPIQEQGVKIDNPYEDKHAGIKAARVSITDEQYRRFEEGVERDRLLEAEKAEERRINGPEHVVNTAATQQPDIKSQLMSHKAFNEEMAVFQHKERQLHEYRLEHLADAKLANAATREMNPRKLNLASADSFNPMHDNRAHGHRVAVMQSVLTPAALMMHEGSMVSAKDAKKIVNNKYGELENGQFMDLNDIEGKTLVGKPSDETTERLTKELAGGDNAEKLVKAITLRDKGSDTETNIYVVENATGELWVRADQTDAQGNIISRNDDSFSAVGLSGDSFKQGIPADDSRFYDGKMKMLDQLDANSMRVALSEKQMQGFAQKTAASEHTLNTGPTPRTPANEDEAFVDSMYEITPLNEEQTKNIGEWAKYQSKSMFGEDSNKPREDIPEGAVFNDAYEIKNKAGDGSVIIANITVKDTEFPYHETQHNITTALNSKGEPTNSVDWQGDLGLDKNSKVSADDIRKGLDRTNSGVYSSKNISAAKMDGTYGASATNAPQAAPVIQAPAPDVAPAAPAMRSARP